MYICIYIQVVAKAAHKELMLARKATKAKANIAKASY